MFRVLQQFCIVMFLLLQASVSLAQTGASIASGATVGDVCREGDTGACIAAALQEGNRNLDTSVVEMLVGSLINRPMLPEQCATMMDPYNRLAQQIQQAYGNDTLAVAVDCSDLANHLNSIAGFPWIQRECGVSSNAFGMTSCLQTLEKATNEKYASALTLLAQRFAGLSGVSFSRDDIMGARREARDDFERLVSDSAALCRKATSDSAAIRLGLIGAMAAHHSYFGVEYTNRAGPLCPDFFRFVKANQLMKDYHIRDWEAQLLREGKITRTQEELDQIRRAATLVGALTPAFKELCDRAYNELYASNSGVRKSFQKSVCRHQYDHGFSGASAVLFGEWYYEWEMGKAELTNCADRVCNFRVPTRCYHSIGKLRSTCVSLTKLNFRGRVSFDNNNRVTVIEISK